MRTTYSGRAARAMLLVAATTVFSHGACSNTPYVGGECQADADCKSKYQYVDDAKCVEQRCTCMGADEHICCAKGQEGNRDCYFSCRPCSACVDGTKGCPPVPGCQSDVECPGPADRRCGTGRCVQGACEVEIHPGPLVSQLRGDCQELQCTDAGEVVSVLETSDIYDDGNQCTEDTCGPDGPRNTPLQNGVVCPTANSGVCFAGDCVQCWDVGLPDACGVNLACDGQYCVPGHCVNFQLDPGETDVDCGGPCAPCTTGHGCAQASDCFNKVCSMGTCQPPLCTDGVKNDAETGTDCGADSCPLCSPGEGCATGADCSSGVCWAGMCEAPTCFDGLKNGTEMGVDCGAACDMPCVMPSLL